MIRLKDFRKIDFEVIRAIQQAFDYARQKEKDKNDFFLFLCNAAYVSENENTSVNPYVIEYYKDTLIDEHRLDFLTKYLKTYYSFNNYNTTDNKDSLTVEMMMYTHIWESKTFLKQLKKLNDLCTGKEYNWKTDVPDALINGSKQSFIRDEIRDRFKTEGLSIADVITKGYRSQFRNAFAHSDYSFGLDEESILLHNYKPGSYEIKSIKIDEWTVFFCYSFLLNYHLQNLHYEERRKVDGEVEVFLRTKNGDKKKGLLTYDNEKNRFAGKLIEE